MQHRQAPLDVFVGRAAERTRIAEVVARVQAGQPWLVAIEGDPGMGKTSLVRRCLAEAPGLRVLQARAGQLGAPQEARRIYSDGEESASAQSPVYTARLLLAHGRLLRRTGQRRLAVERLRRAPGTGQRA